MNTRYPVPAASPLEEDQKQRAQIVRYLCRFTGILVAVYGLVFYIVSGQVIIFYAALVFSVLFFSIMILNTRVNYRFTGFLLQTVFCSVLVYYGIVLGAVAQVQYLAIFLISISALLYKPDDRLLIYCCAALPVLGLFFLEFNYSYRWTYPIYFSEQEERIFRWLILIVVMFLNFLLVQVHQKKILGLLNNARGLHYELALLNESLKIEATGLEKEVQVRTAELSKMVLQLQKANEFQTAFLQQSNREVKSPVGNIIGFSELLLQQKRNPTLSPQQEEELLESLYNSSRHLQSLMNNMQDYAKMEAGEQIELFKEAFVFRDWLATCVTTYDILLQQKESRIRCQADDSVPDTITTDKTRLTQILYHLLGAALQATPAKKDIYIQCWRINSFLVFKMRYYDVASGDVYGTQDTAPDMVKKLLLLFRGDMDIERISEEDILIRIRIPVFTDTH